jgi:FkbM family methyltransferase
LWQSKSGHEKARLLNTAQKIGLARLMSRSVLFGRRAVGKLPEGEFSRGGIRWRLDLREGIDFSIYLLGAFEPRTVRAYRAIVKPGQTVIDIGANIGAHTLPLAKLVGARGRVIAFEPTAFAIQKCAANVALNAELGARISLHQIMLVENEEHSLPPQVFSSWPLVGTGALHERHRGRLMETRGGRAATLDQIANELKLAELHFIKLDVDGYEYPVLAGGRKTLEKHRPLIAMELAPYVHAERGYSLKQLVLTLRDAGYQLRHISNFTPLPLDPVMLSEMIPDGGSVNVLAVPRDYAMPTI